MLYAITGLALLGLAQGCTVQSNIGDGFFTFKNADLPSMSIFTKTPMQYIQGSRTYDTWRYANTRNFPLTTKWTDAANVQWKVTLNSNSDGCTVSVPCNPSTMFYGDERDRVGMDAQVNVCKFNFSYEPGGAWSSHGIRVQSNGYRYNGMGVYMSDTEQWQAVLGLVKQGVEIASAATDVFAKASKAIGAVAAARLAPVDDARDDGPQRIDNRRRNDDYDYGRDERRPRPEGSSFSPLLGKLRQELVEAQHKTQLQLIQFNKLKDMIRGAQKQLKDINEFVQNVETSSQVEVADLSTAQVYLDKLERML